MYLHFITHSPHEYRRPLPIGQRLLCFFLSTIPVVAHSDSELRSVAVKVYGRDGRVVPWILTQTLFNLMVPDRDRAVRAGGGECVVPIRWRPAPQGELKKAGK